MTKRRYEAHRGSDTHYNALAEAETTLINLLAATDPGATPR